MNTLKKLRTSKNLSLAQAVVWFTFPHKVWVYQDAPLDHTLLHKYEQGERKIPEWFIDRYKEHIKSIEKKPHRKAK